MISDVTGLFRLVGCLKNTVDYNSAFTPLVLWRLLVEDQALPVTSEVKLVLYGRASPL